MRDPDALVFDLYGTLLEIASVGRAAGAVTDDPAAFVDLWRQKQLEYTWLRSLMGRYVDFWAVTGDALDYTLERRGVQVDAAGRERLLGAWLDVAPYPEVGDALARLAPRTLAVLSNGSPSMLENGLAAGGLTKAISHVISVHDLSIYKPHPSVYALAGSALALAPERMLFVSSNPWDVAGARSFGLPVAWVNRAGAPMERLGVTPDVAVADLAELAAVVSAL